MCELWTRLQFRGSKTGKRSLLWNRERRVCLENVPVQESSDDFSRSREKLSSCSERTRLCRNGTRKVAAIAIPAACGRERGRSALRSETKQGRRALSSAHASLSRNWLAIAHTRSSGQRLLQSSLSFSRPSARPLVRTCPSFSSVVLPPPAARRHSTAARTPTAPPSSRLDLRSERQHRHHFCVSCLRPSLAGVLPGSPPLLASVSRSTSSLLQQPLALVESSLKQQTHSLQQHHSSTLSSSPSILDLQPIPRTRQRLPYLNTPLQTTQMLTSSTSFAVTALLAAELLSGSANAARSNPAIRRRHHARLAARQEQASNNHTSKRGLTSILTGLGQGTLYYDLNGGGELTSFGD